MVTDTLIILLLAVIAGVIGIMLWRAAEAKTYDPDKVDFSSNFDPQHDHFGKAHAEKVRQAARKKPPVRQRAVAARATAVETTSSDDSWDAHLIRPVAEENSSDVIQSDGATPPQTTDEQQERRSDSDRRANNDRRSGERRANQDRRAASGEA